MKEENIPLSLVLDSTAGDDEDDEADPFMELDDVADPFMELDDDDGD